VAFQIDRIWWLPVGSAKVLTSTFINRNSAATYFGLGAVVATAMLARSFTSTVRFVRDLVGAERREAIIGALTRGLGGWFVVWLLLTVALLSTTSRGGILASLIAITVLLLLRTFRGRGTPSAVPRFVVSGSLLVAVFALVEISGAGFLSRMLVSGITDLDRLYAMEATLNAALDHIWTGAGAGTFQSVFPLYRPASLDRTGYWSSSHNDYLDALLGLGLPAFAVLSFIAASLAYKSLKGLMMRRRDSHFPLIAFSATALVGVHGLVDFSLQIQGITLTFISLLALGVAQSQGSRSG
jgi:O-antigen ligase